MKKLILPLCLILLLCGCGKGYTSYWDVILNRQNTTDTAEAAPDIDYFDTSAAGILLREMQESYAEGEDLDAGSILSNAIIESTRVEIIEDLGYSCTLKITYPDVYSAIIEEALKLPADADQKQLDKLLQDVAKDLKKGRIPMLEGSYTLPIEENSLGVAYIQWSDEARSAMSGGIYGYFAGGEGIE